MVDLKDIHRTLMRRTSDRRIAGVIRERQNWIGTNPYTPVGADYIPPPPEQVEPLLEDLCRFVARDDLAPIAQAAIAHAQFETQIAELQEDWLGRLGRPRADAAVRPLIAELPSQPVVSVAGASRLIGRSGEAARNALIQMETAGIVHPLNERKWGRAWECRELLELIEEFESSVRSGTYSSCKPFKRYDKSAEESVRTPSKIK